MNNILIENLVNATSYDEIISYKTDVLAAYESLYKECYEKGFLCLTNYDDVETLCNLESPMLAYFGPEFYNKCGFPFLKEHNPSTIMVIETAFWFYSIQIINLLESGYWNKVTVCFYDESGEKLENVACFDFLKMNGHKEYLFVKLWEYFMKVITINENDREIIVYDSELSSQIYDIDFLSYGTVIKNSYVSYIDSKYEKIIYMILGNYKNRFISLDYITKYQPLFVKIAWEYLMFLISENKH